MTLTVTIATFYFALIASASAQTSNPVKDSDGAAVYATYAAKPDYPYFARSRRMQGSGVFQLHIRADGTVGSVDTVQSTGHPNSTIRP